MFKGMVGSWTVVGIVLLAVCLVLGAFFGEVLGGNALALMGAGLAVVLSGIGSIVGVGVAGEKAAGITAEEPENFGRVLPLQALPGTQGIYGFLVAFLALIKMNAFGGVLTLTLEQGWQVFFACLPAGLSGLMSALYQAKVSLAGMDIAAQKPDESGKGMILSAMVETYAVLGLLTSILLIMFAVNI
ncbi:MAG: V-type ATP synthase subunit K [Bacillota bacterium]